MKVSHEEKDFKKDGEKPRKKFNSALLKTT